MATEILNEQLTNIHPRFTETLVEQISADEDKWFELVIRITEIQGQTLLAENQGLPVTPEQRDELDRLVNKAWRVDEVLETKQN